MHIFSELIFSLGDHRPLFASRSITRVIFYVRRIGLYLYKYRIYGTITVYFERSSSCLSLDINFASLALSLVKIYSFE